MAAMHCLILRLSKVRGSWFLEATDFCHPQARQIHRCIFAPVTSVKAHYYSVLTTPFDMVNAHYVIIDFRAKFFIKIQNQASDTSRSLPSFSNAPFLLRAVPSERLGQVYLILYRRSSPLFFCVSAIRPDSSLGKYRKQKQSPPGNIQNGTRPGG